MRSRIRYFRVSKAKKETRRNSSELCPVPFQFANGRPSWEEVWGEAPPGLQWTGFLLLGQDKILAAGSFLAPVPVLKRIMHH